MVYAYQEELQRKYDPNNIFNNNPKPVEEPKAVVELVKETVKEEATTSSSKTVDFESSDESLSSSSEGEKRESVSTLVVENVEISSENLPMDYSSYPWYKKIATKIRNFIYKLFKKANTPT